MNGKPPTNLPTSSGAPEEKKEPPRIVPERQVFPKKATERLPEKPQKDRLGEPADVIPKQKEIKKGEEPVSFSPTEGLTPEQVERRETIKKVLIFLIIVLLVVFAGIFVVSKWLLPSKQAEKEIPTPTFSPLQIPTPPKADADEDGILDSWEKEHKLNPQDPNDAKLDPDIDKLTNLEEYKYQTDPQNPDTDKDGYKDGDEVRNGYNPKGAGKLEEKISEGKKDFPTMKGIWEGQMLGAIYQVKDLNLTLQADGNLAGKFTSQYDKNRIQNEMTGSYDFKKETGIFSATLSGQSTFLGKLKSGVTEGLFTVTIEGKESNDGITGTWVLSPKTSGLVWLKNDRGNLKIKKQ